MFNDTVARIRCQMCDPPAPKRLFLDPENDPSGPNLRELTLKADQNPRLLRTSEVMSSELQKPHRYHLYRVFTLNFAYPQKRLRFIKLFAMTSIYYFFLRFRTFRR